MDLTDKAQITQRDIAHRLDVGENYISRVKRGAEPSTRLVLALESIHKEHFSKAEGSEIQIREQTVPYGSFASVELETWAEETGMSVQEFTRKCLDRYGPILFKDLKHAHERRNLKRAQPSPDEPAGDVAQRMIKRKEKD